ncbi:MAG: hypothetical protein HZA90_28700 [Verrucomicrobia bacterium]|nr:hypothetical protein [Verrucomicrobiota bacterium]
MRKYFMILGREDLLDELQEDLTKQGIPCERSLLMANSADANTFPYISAAIGAGMTLLTHAIISYLERKKGQRKIVVQMEDYPRGVKRIEIETPRFDEMKKLLEQARQAFVVEKTPNQPLEPISVMPPAAQEPRQP